MPTLPIQNNAANATANSAVSSTPPIVVNEAHTGIGVFSLIISIILLFVVIPGLVLSSNFIPSMSANYTLFAILALGISFGLSYGLASLGAKKIFWVVHLIVALPIAASYGIMSITSKLSVLFANLQTGDVGAAGGQAGATSGLISLFSQTLNPIILLVILVICLHAYPLYLLISGKEKLSNSLYVVFVGIILIVIAHFWVLHTLSAMTAGY